MTKSSDTPHKTSHFPKHCCHGQNIASEHTPLAKFIKNLKAKKQFSMQENSINRRKALQGLAGIGIIGAGTGVSGCSKNLATGKNIFTLGKGVNEDIEMGRKNHPEVLKAFGGIYEDHKLASYITNIGNRMAEHAEIKEFEYRFFVLDSPIVNAFALPGGYIYISRGLMALANTEAELAGVIGHEIGHVTARHSAQRMASTTMWKLGLSLMEIGLAVAGSPARNLANQFGTLIASAVLASHSREQELESDYLGMKYMDMVNYDPSSVAKFFTSMSEHSRWQMQREGRNPDDVDKLHFLSTHPLSSDRSEISMQKASRMSGTLIKQDEYFANINGMLFGDDPELGIIDGSKFEHGPFRLAFTVLEGFVLRNAPTEVTAFRESDKSGFKLTLLEEPVGLSMDDKLASIDGIKMNTIEKITLPNASTQNAATAISYINNGWGEENQSVRVLLLRGEDEQVFSFGYYAKESLFSKLDAQFKESLQNITYLTNANTISGYRIIIAPVTEGDTVSKLSNSMPGYNNEDREQGFRVINHLSSEQKLSIGTQIKVVTR